MEFRAAITTRERFIEDYDGTDQDLIEARRAQMIKEADQVSFPMVFLFGLITLIGFPVLASLAPIKALLPNISNSAVFAAAVLMCYVLARAATFSQRFLARSDRYMRWVCWTERLTGRTVALALRAVEEVYITPLVISLDTSGDTPSLSWEVEEGARRLASRKERAIDAGVEFEEAGSSGPTLKDGQLDLSGRSAAFDLTRHGGRLCLLCRATDAARPSGSITFVFDRPEWLEAPLFEALPHLERDGVELDAATGAELLKHIALVASTNGTPFPVRAEAAVTARA